MKSTAMDATAGGLSKWIVRARKIRWIQHLARLLPSSLRRRAWEAAASESHYQILGSCMFIPSHARNLSLLLDEYEPDVTECMRCILRPGMSFCDVGANLGVFTLFASKLVGPSGRVVAFEPVPENAEVLRTNLALNECKNVLVLEKAVSEQRGTATLHLSSQCGCHSLVSQPPGATARTISVETIPLQDVNELADIDLLKIDVEGAELTALRSLGTHRPKHIILEYNAERTRAAGANGAQFVQSLRDLGYDNIESLEEGADGSLASISAERCAAANLHAFR